MKLSINWANKFSNVNIMPKGVDELTHKIGSQLGAIEDVVFFGKKYEGIVIVRVVSCIKHPNADKLSLCKIDDGGVVEGVERDEDGNVQVVCGAPNVRQDLMVAWIPPGCTVPSTVVTKEPFILGARELRGYLSNGMLASPSELGLSDDHDGILEISKKDNLNIKPGSLFRELYDLNDTIIDLENKMFTHRPDCFGILGVARELAGIQNLRFSSPEWYLNEPKFAEADELPLNVKLETNAVSRLMAVVMSDVKVSKSPIELQSDLSRVGIRPINNIVDITNWLMYLTAQPIHAYDYDKVKKLSNNTPSLIARDSVKDEELGLLNGKTIKLENNKSVVIATDKMAIGMGGVMGGADTEVDENTKNIIIEIATFDMYGIRKTSMIYGLFTDAVTRFNKGQSPLQNDRVMQRIMQMINEYAGGKQASSVYDINTRDIEPLKPIEVNAEFINTRLGSDLDLNKMQKLLQNVEIDSRIADDKLLITPPFWRQDLHIKEDIVEEIGRLYGFSNLPVKLPSRNANPTNKNKMLNLKQSIRQYLAANGANEILTYNFVHGDLFNKVGQDPTSAYELGNAISPSLQHFRLSITPNLLEKVHPNVKAGYDKFCIFEIGKAHNKNNTEENNLPRELERLALVFAANNKEQQNYSGAAFYQAKVYLSGLLKNLNIKIKYLPLNEYKGTDNQLVKPFLDSRSAQIISDGGEFIGVIGEYKFNVLKQLKLPEYCAGFELDINKILELYNAQNIYNQISKYPSIQQDISLKTTKEVNYQTIKDVIDKQLLSLSNDELKMYADVIDIYSDANFVSYTFGVNVNRLDRTLKNDEVNALLDKLADETNKILGATRI